MMMKDSKYPIYRTYITCNSMCCSLLNPPSISTQFLHSMYLPDRNYPPTQTTRRYLQFPQVYVLKLFIIVEYLWNIQVQNTTQFLFLTKSIIHIIKYCIFYVPHFQPLCLTLHIGICEMFLLNQKIEQVIYFILITLSIPCT